MNTTRIQLMGLRVTIDIFSGRPNPVIELDQNETEIALSRLRPVRRLRSKEPRLPREPTLGYRGLIIEQSEAARGLPRLFRYANGDMFGEGLAHRAKDADFEAFVLEHTSLQRQSLGTDFPKFLTNEIARFESLRSHYKERHPKWPKRERCRCAPLYEPGWWNDAGQKQYNNNCYNYSTNYRTDTFAQPGRAAGAEYTAFSCTSVKPAAVADDLIDSPNANNRCPKEGHLVALVIAPGWDFHWYRKGRNGYWSHKPGGTPVTNVDNSGNTIPDPRTANRGPYTNFCTFMVVMHGHIKIN